MYEPRRVDGIWLDPKLPEDFDSTPNDARPESHMQWWCVPYIVTSPADEWSSESFVVRCLDGGAWDRSTWKGQFDTLAAAIKFVNEITQDR